MCKNVQKDGQGKMWAAMRSLQSSNRQHKLQQKHIGQIRKTTFGLYRLNFCQTGFQLPHQEIPEKKICGINTQMGNSETYLTQKRGTKEIVEQIKDNNNKTKQ